MTEGKITQIVEMISSLTVLELKELVDVLKEKFGVQSIPVAGIPQGAAVQQQAAPQAEEKTEYEVILTSFGNSKLNVIKEVRTITGLGLKEAKDIVDGAPKALKENISLEEAEEIKKKLEAVGATIEIK